MVTITIKRGVKGGNPFMTTHCGKDDMPVDHLLSRDLTGTTNEESVGVFTQDVSVLWFDYGKTRKSFQVAPINFSTDSMEKLEDELQRRVRVVREWVATIDRSEEFSFNLS
jgi:hypothetical protein